MDIIPQSCLREWPEFPVAVQILLSSRWILYHNLVLESGPNFRWQYNKNYSRIARDLFYLWGLSVLTLYAYHTILDNLSLGNLNENDFDIYRNKIEEFYPTFRKYLDKFMAVQKRQNTDYHDMNFS